MAVKLFSWKFRFIIDARCSWKLDHENFICKTLFLCKTIKVYLSKILGYTVIIKKVSSQVFIPSFMSQNPLRKIRKKLIRSYITTFSYIVIISRKWIATVDAIVVVMYMCVYTVNCCVDYVRVLFRHVMSIPWMYLFFLTHCCINYSHSIT